MASRGNPFPQEHSTDDSFETNFPKRPNTEWKVKPDSDNTEYLYPVANEVVDHLRKITRSYAKKLVGFPNIPALPRRQVHKKKFPYLEDSLLVRDFEELIDLTLQEIDQPLDQLGPDSPVGTPFQYPPRSPKSIMAENVPPNPNANQANPPTPSWRAITPLNLAPPMHAFP